jgi:hypothetical protein
LCQAIRAWPNRRYRLDIHAEPPAVRSGRFSGGSVQVRFASLRADEEIRVYEPPVMRIGGDASVVHRAFFQCPPGTGRLRVCLRFRVGKPIVVQRVRLVECGDYLLTGHPLAMPPEPWREPPPCLPASVILCDGRTDSRPLLAWLREVFGEGNVDRIAPSELLRRHAHVAAKHYPVQAPCEAGGRPRTAQRTAALGCATEDDEDIARPEGWPPNHNGVERDTSGGESADPAIIIDLPANRSPRLPDLLAWSDRTIVIASLATFVGSAGRAGLPGIRLQDRVSGVDMPCGKIVLSGYYTRGFALADTIPYAWNDGRDNFAHRYLAMTKPAQAKLGQMGIRPALVTDCGQREVDNRPLALYRPGRNGALVVLDPDTLEAPSAGQDVPRTFDLLWRSALGHDTVTLGQFSAPPTHYEGVVTDLVELARQHYDMIEDVSISARTHGKGNRPPIWLFPGRRGDPLSRRKALLIRAGFAEAEWPAVYGLLLWLKGVAMAAMRGEPVSRVLLERTRLLAWPIAQPQNWRGCPADVTSPRLDMPVGDLLGRIDLRIGRQRHTSILVPDRQREAIVRRSVLGWPRLAHPTPQIRIDRGAFEDEPLAQSGRTDLVLCKVLLPGVPQAYPANSPILADMAATLLERLAFATIGLIVPNRSWRRQEVDLGAPGTTMRRTLLVQPAGQVQRVDVRRARRIVVPPGATIVGLSGRRSYGAKRQLRNR